MDRGAWRVTIHRGPKESDRTEPKHLFPLPHLAPPPAPSVGLPQAPPSPLRSEEEETLSFYSAPGKAHALLSILPITQPCAYCSFCLRNEKTGLRGVKSLAQSRTASGSRAGTRAQGCLIPRLCSAHHHPLPHGWTV